LTDTTTIELSRQTYDKLHSVQMNLKKILNRNITLSQVLDVLLSVKHVEEAIADIVLDDTPHWRRSGRKRNEEEEGEK